MTLLPKPSACVGCELYGSGQGFVPDAIQPQATVHVVAQNPGADEEQGRRFLGYQGREKCYEPAPHGPMTGVTGAELDRLLPLAGLDRESISLSNAIRCRLNGSNDLPSVTDPVHGAKIRAAIVHCQAAHSRPQEGTQLYVALGEHALWALTGHTNVGDWRGWLSPYAPKIHEDTGYVGTTGIYHPTKHLKGVLATYHPAYLFRAPWDRPVAQRDWAKVPEILTGRWPKRLPMIEDQPPARWPALSAFDTEYNPVYNNRLYRYSLAYDDRVHVVEARNNWPVVGAPEDRVIFHNTEADYTHLLKIRRKVPFQIEDTMYLDSVLWPDLDHDLGHVGSRYSSLNRWKQLQYVNPRVYSAADAWATWEIWQAQQRELARDPRVKHVYEAYRLPLVQMILATRQVGIKVNQPNAQAALEILEAQRQDAQALAQASVGWPMNVGSPAQVKAALHGKEI